MARVIDIAMVDQAILDSFARLGLTNAKYVLVTKTDQHKAICTNINVTDDAVRLLTEAAMVVAMSEDEDEQEAGHA